MPFDNLNETKPDVFSLEGLAAWLRTQPPETKYNWMSNIDCLVERYGKACGVPQFEMHSYFWHKGWLGIAYNSGKGWTYGEALARCIAYLYEERNHETASGNNQGTSGERLVDTVCS